MLLVINLRADACSWMNRLERSIAIICDEWLNNLVGGREREMTRFRKSLRQILRCLPQIMFYEILSAYLGRKPPTFGVQPRVDGLPCVPLLGNWVSGASGDGTTFHCSRLGRRERGASVSAVITEFCLGLVWKEEAIGCACSAFERKFHHRS